MKPTPAFRAALWNGIFRKYMVYPVGQGPRPVLASTPDSYRLEPVRNQPAITNDIARCANYLYLDKMPVKGVVFLERTVPELVREPQYVSDNGLILYVTDPFGGRSRPLQRPKKQSLMNWMTTKALNWITYDHDIPLVTVDTSSLLVILQDWTWITIQCPEGD